MRFFFVGYNVTNSQNTKIAYGQPSEKLFTKRWPLSNRDRNTRRVKGHRNSDTKTRQRDREPKQNEIEAIGNAY